MRLLFQDKARFGCISNQRRCWAPWPLRPIVGNQIIREFVYGLAAVSPLNRQLCSLRENYIGKEVFKPLDADVDHLCLGLHYRHQHREIVRSMTCFDWIKTLSWTLT